MTPLESSALRLIRKRKKITHKDFCAELGLNKNQGRNVVVALRDFGFIVTGAERVEGITETIHEPKFKPRLPKITCGVPYKREWYRPSGTYLRGCAA